VRFSALAGVGFFRSTSPVLRCLRSHHDRASGHFFSDALRANAIRLGWLVTSSLFYPTSQPCGLRHCVILHPHPQRQANNKNIPTCHHLLSPAGTYINLPSTGVVIFIVSSSSSSSYGATTILGRKHHKHTSQTSTVESRCIAHIQCASRARRHSPRLSVRHHPRALRKSVGCLVEEASVCCHSLFISLTDFAMLAMFFPQRMLLALHCCGPVGRDKPVKLANSVWLQDITCANRWQAHSEFSFVPHPGHPC